MMKKLTLFLCCLFSFFACEGQKSEDEMRAELRKIYEESIAKVSEKIPNFKALLDEHAVETRYGYTPVASMNVLTMYWTAKDLELLMKHTEKLPENGYQSLLQEKELENVFIVFYNWRQGFPGLFGERKTQVEPLAREIEYLLENPSIRIDSLVRQHLEERSSLSWRGTVSQYKVDLLKGVKGLKNIDYVAFSKVKIYIEPEVKDDVHKSGVAVSEVMIYDLKTKELVETLTALGTNSKMISSYNGFETFEASSNLKSNLEDNVKCQIIRHLGEKVRVIED